MNAMKLAVPLFVALAYGPSQGWASAILGSDLASFAVLGHTTVTNTNPATNLPFGPTTITGNVGDWTMPVAPNAVAGLLPTQVSGTIYQGPAPGTSTQALAQSQLAIARTDLGLLGPGTPEPVDLSGLTLFPGVYTVPAGASNLTGTLTLDGQGNANAFWVFQMPSTLITSPGSVVNVINTGPGAGLFWNVGSSAIIDTTTSFEGNILALAAITLNTGATIGCGRALANTAAVTMDTNTISIGCTTELGGSTTHLAGSNGLSGGLTVIPGPNGTGTPTPLPFAPVPEPGTFVLFGFGLAGLFVFRKRLPPVA
jgi:hypothetical protein